MARACWADAKMSCNWQELVRLVREIRHGQQKLHPLMIDKKTEHVVAELERYSGIGVKLLGGGGPEACILVVCGSDHESALSRSLLKKYGHYILPVRVAKKGLQYTIKRNT